MRARIAIFVAIVQSMLFFAHWFVYATWVDFWGVPDPAGVSRLQVALAVLSITFVAASLLAFRTAHILVRLFYAISAVWLGILSFCFFAACACRILDDLARLSGFSPDRRAFAEVFFGLAILAGVYGVLNAAWIRVKRITVKLPNLPESWCGRLAAQVSDTHLGHVRGRAFARRIVARLTRLRPDVVFITGDLFDGTAADLRRLTEPFEQLSAPLGAYFVTGNHEEFSDHTKYLEAVERAGIRVLNNEKVTLEGLQVVGVHYRDSTDAQSFRSILQQADLDPGRASILLTHAPDRLPLAAEAGISLQLSGHTHAGQFFPYTWIASLLYGRFVYGLRRLGNLAVYISCGAGTWGPPMRVGTSSEIVLIRFE